MNETKKWYQSKIVLASIVLAMVALGNLVTGFLTGQGVTPEQMHVIQVAYPDVAEQIKSLQSGATVIELISGLVPILIAVFRVWGTNTVISTPPTKVARE